MKRKYNILAGGIEGISSIGLDFDNTIVCYEDIFQNLAEQNNWIQSEKKLTKSDIKDKILSLKNGLFKWKTMQSLVYSDLISSATPMQGVFDFIKKCNNHNIDFYIVSHKTEYAEITTSGNNLRDMALEWLMKNFAHHKLTLPLDSIYFAHTREDKINTIRSLNCTYFIDDLEEVLSHSLFPDDVQKILINGSNNHNFPNSEIIMKKNWNEIEEYVFG